MRRFKCWDQFLCLCFGQLTFRDSLRDIVTTLDALGSRRYHMGIKTNVARNTFSRANANRPWQIYQDLAMVLIDRARKVVSDQNELERATDSIYALDSTTIDLCLSLFPWAKFRFHKAAIKLHTLIYVQLLNDQIPEVRNEWDRASWSHYITDIPTMIQMKMRGMYSKPDENPTKQAVFDMKDVKPAIFELLYLPYLIKLRG